MFGRLVEKLAPASRIRIRSHLCVRVRYPRASCRLCQSICPSSSVEIEGEQVKVNNSCSGCRACVTACPAGVFELPDRLQMEGHDRIRQALQSDPVVRFTCLRNSESDREDVLAVPCLAGLSHGELIAPLAWGAEKVEVKTPPCHGCEMKEARKQYDCILPGVHGLLACFQISPDRVEEVREFSQPPVTAAESFRSPDGGLDRREFFRLMRRRGVNRVLEAMPEPATTCETDRWGHRENGQRSFLLGLLPRLGPLAKSTLSPQVFPVQDLMVASHCVGCNICETLCPTGAIRRDVDEGGRIKLHFTAARCTGCGVCAEACPPGAIAHGENVNLKELIGGKERLLVHVVSRMCRVCGEAFSGLPGPICPSCVASRRNGMAGTVWTEGE